MLIYYYHPITTTFLIAVEAEVDKIDFTPIIPAYCTVIKPPEVSNKECAFFDIAEQKWTVEKIQEPVLPTIEQLRERMSLTAAQARFRLAKAGKLLSIIEMINAMPDDIELKIMWEYETVFKRLNPVLCDFCKQSLGLTDEQIDNLFTGNLE